VATKTPALQLAVNTTTYKTTFRICIFPMKNINDFNIWAFYSEYISIVTINSVFGGAEKDFFALFTHNETHKIDDSNGISR